MIIEEVSAKNKHHSFQRLTNKHSSVILSFYMYIPYSLKFSRIKYFVVWLNSAQKKFFADKIFVDESESREVHTYVYNKY